MPMHNTNGQQNPNGASNGQTNHYANAQSMTSRGGLAQPLDPMGGNTPNVFDVLDAKNGKGGQFLPNNGNVNPQGMPQGAAPMNAPDTTGIIDPNTQGGGSPMDKWFSKPDNGGQGQQPASNPASNPAEAPKPFESVFARSTMEEYQGVIGQRDFASAHFTPELQEQFSQGDFSGMPSMINAAVQQGVALAAFLSGKVADKGVGSILENFQKTTLPGMLNNHQLENMWQQPDFADFSKPEMQPMVQMATAHVKSMFPNASPQQIQQKAMEMMRDMTQHMTSLNFNKGTNSQQPQQAPAGNDMSEMERLFGGY